MNQLIWSSLKFSPKNKIPKPNFNFFEKRHFWEIFRRAKAPNQILFFGNFFWAKFFLEEIFSSYKILIILKKIFVACFPLLIHHVLLSPFPLFKCIKYYFLFLGNLFRRRHTFFLTGPNPNIDPNLFLKNQICRKKFSHFLLSDPKFDQPAHHYPTPKSPKNIICLIK